MVVLRDQVEPDRSGRGVNGGSAIHHDGVKKPASSRIHSVSVSVTFRSGICTSFRLALDDGFRLS
jgi:hypothetical protein